MIEVDKKDFKQVTSRCQHGKALYVTTQHICFCYGGNTVEGEETR